MALAGEVTRELSPIRSWSNNNYDLKLAEKGKGKGVACSGSAVALREATSLDTLPFAQPAGAQKILYTPEVRSQVHNSTWAYFFKTDENTVNFSRKNKKIRGKSEPNKTRVTQSSSTH